MLNRFIGPEIFEQSIWVSLISFLFQNTLVTLLILALFGLVILQESISHLFIKSDEETGEQKHQRRYFWQTLFLIPVVSVPFLWVMYRFGTFEIYFTTQTFGLMLVQLITMIVLHDAYFYWCHRLMHTNAFWDIHGVHHRDVDPNIVTSHVFHHVETAINYTFLVWFTLLAGLIAGGVFFLPSLVFVVFTIAWNIYGHGSKNLLPDKITQSSLGMLIVWPSYHLEHHRQGRGNFGFFFTWWDRMIGTRVQ